MRPRTVAGAPPDMSLSERISSRFPKRSRSQGGEQHQDQPKGHAHSKGAFAKRLTYLAALGLMV